MSERVPGPTGKKSLNTSQIDAGTMARTRMYRPGPSGIYQSVVGMPIEDRFRTVLTLTAPKLPGEVREEFMAMLTPMNIAIMVGVLAAWAGSHAIGIGFFADAILLVSGVALIGWQIWTAAEDFLSFITITSSATTFDDLNLAATHLTKFIVVVGVTVLMALLMKGAKGVKGRLLATSAAQGASRAGIAVEHFAIFQKVAAAEKQIIAVRYTNPKSVQWIQKGFPAKPLKIKIKTSKTTGIVTASSEGEINAARKAGYYVIDKDGIARGWRLNKGGNTTDLAALDLKGKTNWPLETGQVIHPDQLKPLVGDYDLLAVIDPKAMGRNIALATKDGEAVASRTNPIIERVRRALNSRMGQDRVMHGSHDAFDDLRSAVSKSGDGAIVFTPEGEVRLLNNLEDVEEFYRLIGRQTMKGSYNPVAPGGYDPSL